MGFGGRSCSCLPAITRQLTPPQFEALLAHELCHVRRVAIILQIVVHMVVETVFWFHPQVYAEGILRICELYLASPRCRASPTAGVTGANLKGRIEEIMENRAALRPLVSAGEPS